MKTMILVFFSAFLLTLMSPSTNEKHDLTVKANHLRNSKGVVQFALYNKAGTIPDEYYEKHFKIGKSKIVNGRAQFTFSNLPKGKYAVNILHDENKDGKIDKGFIFPVEGIGFSNYQSIGLTNRPNFEQASFELKKDELVEVKVIYM